MGDEAEETDTQSGDQEVVTLDEVKRELEDEPDLSDEEIEAAIERIVGERADSGSDKDERINPNAGEESGGRTRVVGPILEPWKERAVQYLNARAAQFEARHGIGTTTRQEAEQEMQSVRQEAKQMNDRQIADELQETVRVLDEAEISDSKRAAYVSAFELRDV